MAESVGSLKCQKCSRDLPTLHCMKCQGEVTKDMACSKCHALISAILCPYCKKLTIREPVDWELTSKLKPEAAEPLMLESGEMVLTVWNGNREILRKGIGSQGRVQTGKEWEVGSLCLTNRRLIWLVQRGVDVKSWHVGCTIPLEEIAGVSSEGAELKCISIATSREEYRFHLKSWLDKYKRWIDHNWVFPYVEIAVKERRKELEKIKRTEKVQVVLDFARLQDYLKQGGLVIQNTRCPECGASIKLPKEGSQTKCEYCGANVYAQDVFKKIKELIG